MSTNFSIYEVATNDLYADELSVGDKLVRVMRPKYGHSEFKTIEYVVIKILKTRVVVESVNPIYQGRKHEIRLIVESGKWANPGPGRITNKREGGSNSWFHDVYEFATPDDSAVEHLRQKHAAIKRDADRRSAASNRIARIKNALRPDLESINEAIQSLQALADDLRD